MKHVSMTFIGIIALGLPLAVGLTYLMMNPAMAQEVEAATGATGASAYAGWAMIGAAIASGLASVGAAYAVAVVGSAAVGVLAEKPETMGRLLILVGLAEGIAIYGLIVAVLILNKV